MQNKLEILVGAVVFAVAVAFVVFAGMRTDFLSGGQDGYVLSAKFRSAQGVRVGTDVRLAGVKVGHVSDMELDLETYEARVDVKLDENVLVPDDSSITIASEGLLGGNFIEIAPGGSPFYYEAGDIVEDTQSAVSLATLLMRFVGGAAN